MKHVSLFALLCVIAGCGPGPMGPMGPQGPAGPTGPQGPSGFTRYGHCTTVVSTGQVADYFAAEYSNGDTLTSCGVSDARNTYSGFHIWLAGSAGATEKRCVVVYDLDTPSVGAWVFSTSGSTRSIRYVDASSSGNGATATFPASSCQSRP